MTPRSTLFLVSDLEEQRAAAASKRTVPAVLDGDQYLLPLDDLKVDRRVVVVPMEQAHGLELRKLLFQLKPRKAFDLRSLLRFEIPGADRDTFFGWLREVETNYVRIRIDWRSFDLSDFVLRDNWISPLLGHELLSLSDGIVLMLISNSNEYTRIAAHLNRQMMRHSANRWVVESAVFG